MSARPGPSPWIGAMLVASCLAACRERPPPELYGVTPSEVPHDAPARILVEGEEFYADLRDPFWSSQPATLNARFRIWIGDVELPDGAASQIDTRRLDAALPAGLPLGLHPVRVRTPAGEEASLPDALAVVDSAPPLSLAFASAPQHIAAGECSAPVLLELRDGEGASAPAPDLTVVSLAGEPPGPSFFSDGACDFATSTANILAGQAAATVYARATDAGGYVLQADAGAYGAAVQPLDVAPASGFTWSPIPAQASGTAFPVGIKARDVHGQLDSSYGGSAELALVGEGTLSCPAGCAGLVAGPFDAGTWAGTVSVTVSQGGPRTLSATDAARSGSSAAFNILPSRSPPLALLEITPGAFTVEDTATLDASGSSDYQTAAADLQYSFDVDGTAAGPPPWTPWSPSSTMAHAYATEGSFTARVAVRDADGDVGYAAAIVLVLRSRTKPCVVTSPWAAADDGASGCTGSPGPDQMLSLAEALRIGRASGERFGVVLGPDLTVTGPADLTASGDLWLMGGVNTRLVDVSLRVLGGSTLILSGVTLEGSTSLLSVDPSGVAVLEDVAVRNAPALQVQGTLRLRRSELTGCVGACVALTAPGASLSGRSTLFADAPAGIDATSCGADAGVDVVSCTFARLGAGLRLGAGCANTRIVNDTVHGNGVGISYTSGSGHVLRNVAFSENGTAVECGSAGFQRADFALLWNNAGAGCAPADPATISADPMYLMPDWSDFRLHLGSPAVDSGADAGVDVNGEAPGDFTGAAPDRGGRETW